MSCSRTVLLQFCVNSYPGFSLVFYGRMLNNSIYDTAYFSVLYPHFASVCSVFISSY